VSRIARDLGTVTGNDLIRELLEDEAGIDGLCQHLYFLTGISLPPIAKNRHLVVSRLSSVLRKQRLTSLRAYLKMLKMRPPEDPLSSEFISALTTNTTQFFREPAHFDFLSGVLPDYLAAKSRGYGPDAQELRVWCAAASTGQEPFSMLILVQNELQRQAALRRAWRLKFLASDIDEAVLERASRGIYSAHETQGLSDDVRERFFLPAIDPVTGGEGAVRIHPELLSKIAFARINLVSMPYPFQHPFDIVFLRNVLIYFDPNTVARIIEQMARAIRPGGLLFLGHSESGCMKSPHFKPLAHAVYQRVG
jgi:chemotaxis protein methyltransferase CheR